MDTWEITRLFETNKGQSIAIIGSDLETADKFISELSARDDLFKMKICVEVNQFTDAQAFHLALLEALQKQVQDMGVSLPGYIMRVMANQKTLMGQFSVLLRDMERRFEQRILLCLKNFQCISNFYTSSNSSDYMNFRQCTCSLLLTANQPLIEIEHASIGYHLNSTLTHEVKEVKL